MPTSFATLVSDVQQIMQGSTPAETKILTAIALLSQALAADSQEINTKLDDIRAWINVESAVKAESYLSIPHTVRGHTSMNFDLKNDWVLGPITIVAKDAEGSVVPMPDGVTFASAVSDTTALNVVDNDGSHFTVNALKWPVTGVTITHHDSSGQLPDFTDTVNIVEDLTPAVADSDVADAAHTMQPIPPHA